ncbi:MAG: 30S ribosomal protein S11 [Deltaproteobacteria bacterium CG07_land_8_20_14_0_80_38_7]|nr:MAG: 30S ribosomal protein S11 [Deltaproteobacteria bacterium CG07_land_8_20_14_0_80_38_7]
MAEKVAQVQKKTKKRAKKNVPVGIIHILSSFNNTIITVTDTAGNTISWATAGTKGFKGSRKGTPFAAQLAAEDAVRKAMDHGLRSASVIIKGPGSGREAALRSLQKTGIKVLAIRDMTPIPHNGCRPPKRRRV